MKTILLLLPVFASLHLYAQNENEKRNLSFCSWTGPVELIIEGQNVKGTYIITVTSPPIYGTLEGKIDSGLIRGKWSDKDGIGNFVFGFDPEMTKFNGIFTTAKDHSNWDNQWKGVRKDLLHTVKEAERKDFSCTTK